MDGSSRPRFHPQAPDACVQVPKDGLAWSYGVAPEQIRRTPLTRQVCHEAAGKSIIVFRCGAEIPDIRARMRGAPGLGLEKSTMTAYLWLNVGRADDLGKRRPA